MHSTAWPLHSRIILASQESNGNAVAEKVWMLGVEQQQDHQHEHQNHQPCFHCSIQSSQAHFRHMMLLSSAFEVSVERHREEQQERHWCMEKHLRSILKGRQLETYIKNKLWAFDSRNHVASLIHPPSSCAGQCHLQQSSVQDSTDSNTIQRLIYGFSNIWVGVCLKSRGPRIQLIYLKTQATWGALAVT